MIDISKNIVDFNQDEIEEFCDILSMKLKDAGIDESNGEDYTIDLTMEDIRNYYERTGKLTLPRRFGMIRPQKSIDTVSDIKLDHTLELAETQNEQTSDENTISIFGDDDVEEE